MHLRKIFSQRLIAFFVLFALAFSQIAISAHAVVHQDHAVSMAHNGDHKDGEPKSGKRKCPECLLTKVFQTALTVDAGLRFDPFISVPPPAATSLSISTAKSPEYGARAPPFFLV
jgi:hypothetical protein